MGNTWKFYCTQCGNRTVADILGTATETEWADIDEKYGYQPSRDTYYTVVKCNTCTTVQLFTYDEYCEDGLDEAVLLYPTARSIPKDVPQIIAKEFAEAQKVERISKTAYAVLIGRVLERLFNDKGAVGKDLFDQIKDLSAKGIIPDTLRDMGDTLRFLRNKGAHVSDYEIEDNEVDAMRDFVITMLEYVYVAPAKLAALKAAIEKKKAVVEKRKSSQ